MGSYIKKDHSRGKFCTFLAFLNGEKCLRKPSTLGHFDIGSNNYFNFGYLYPI